MRPPKIDRPFDEGRLEDTVNEMEQLTKETAKQVRALYQMFRSQAVAGPIPGPRQSLSLSNLVPLESMERLVIESMERLVAKKG